MYYTARGMDGSYERLFRCIRCARDVRYTLGSAKDYYRKESETGHATDCSMAVRQQYEREMELKRREVRALEKTAEAQRSIAHTKYLTYLRHR